MKFKLPITTTILLVILSAGCKENSIREIPKETKKRIITTFYKPIEHNGEITCGEEMDVDGTDSSTLPDTAYYDEFNNLLLSISKCNSIVKKYEYFSSSEHKLKHELIKYYNHADSSESEEETEYIRDNTGKLIQTKGNKNSEQYNHFFKYDVSGFRTQQLDKNKQVEESYNKVPSTNKNFETVIKTIYNSKGEIEECFTYITNKKNNNLEREIEEFKSNGVEIKNDSRYYYNSSNETIKKTVIVTKSDIVTSEISFDYHYNSNGDISLIKCYALDGNGKCVINTLKQYEYEYNKKNEWVKRLYFSKSLDTTTFDYGYITIRQIDYF